jgi:L-alanine-DL-glutamate epimerase-like enolase superfamily enzyme
MYLAREGYRALIVPARPNADRRVLGPVFEVAEKPIAIGLGGVYRMADYKALSVLDSLGASMLIQPFRSWDLAGASRLRRVLATPLSMGDWVSAEQVEGAVALGAADVIELDPGLTGLYEALRIAGIAARDGVGLWVSSKAATMIGAASDLAIAGHGAVTYPCDFTVARGSDARVAIGPDENGRAIPFTGPGCGVVPPDDWLAEMTTEQATLRA